jgi:tetratricopeptide (TPR) repeat protein
LGNKALLAQALYNLTFPLGEVEPEAGLKMGEEAMGIFVEIGDEVGAARAAFSISGSYGVLGQFDRSLAAAEGAVPVFRERGLRFDLAWQLHQLGWAYVKLGRLAEALPSLIESIEYLDEAHDQVGMSIVLADFSDMAFAMDEPLDGMRLRGASNAIQERTGGGLEGIIGLAYNQRDRLDGPQTPDEQKALDEGLAMDADQALELARDLAARVGSKTA